MLRQCSLFTVCLKKNGPINPLVETAMPTVTLSEGCIFLVSICGFLGTQNCTLYSVSHPSGNGFIWETHIIQWFLHALPTQQTTFCVRTGTEFLQHSLCTNTGANHHANFTAQIVWVSLILLQHLWLIFSGFSAQLLSQLQCSIS